MGILDMLRQRRAQKEETRRLEQELTDIIEQGPKWDELKMPDLKNPDHTKVFPQPGSYLDRVMSIPREVVEVKMNLFLRQQDYESLERIRGVYRGVTPDQKNVQKAYARHYRNSEMDKAKKLFEVTGIEPKHEMSETSKTVKNAEFPELIVADKNVVKSRGLNHYYISFIIPESSIGLTVHVPYGYYNKALIGAQRSLVLPLAEERYNMLGHKIEVIPKSVPRYGLQVHV
jgi:hypothetical protein